jgi:hypothetical protein
MQIVMDQKILYFSLLGTNSQQAHWEFLKQIFSSLVRDESNIFEIAIVLTLRCFVFFNNKNRRRI